MAATPYPTYGDEWYVGVPDGGYALSDLRGRVVCRPDKRERHPAF